MATINGKALVKDGKPLDRAYSNGQVVYSRNLLLNSKILSWSVGNIKVTISTVSYDGVTNMWHITSPKGGSDTAGIYFWPTNNVTKGQQWTFSFDIKGTGVYSKYGMGVGIDASSPINKLSGNVPADWTRVSSTGTATGTNPIIIYFNSIDVALDVYIKLPKLESRNTPTPWTPAPEDYV